MAVMEISLPWSLSGRMQWFIGCLHSRTVMFWQPFCAVVIHCPGWQRTHKHILFDVCHDAVTGEWSWAHAAESIATGRRTCQPFRSSSTSYKAVCTQSANAFMAEASYNQLLLILPRICSWSTHDQLMINSWSTPSYHHHSNEPLRYHISELCRWQLSLHVYHLCTSHIHCLFGSVKPHLYANIVLVQYLVCSIVRPDPFSLAQFPPLPRNPCMALCVHFHSMVRDGWM